MIRKKLINAVLIRRDIKDRISISIPQKAYNHHEYYPYQIATHIRSIGQQEDTEKNLITCYDLLTHASVQQGLNQEVCCKQLKKIQPIN